MIPYSTFNVFLGNDDKALNGLVTKALHEALGKDFYVKVSVMNHIDDVTRCTKYRYELWILVFHGITVPSSKSGTSVFPHVDRILDVVASLKAKHRTPVIALSSFINPELPERVRSAGTDVYFELPVEPKQLRRAILRCAKMFGRAPDNFWKKIPQLPQPNQHHLTAAEGWLELGNHLEANDELEKIEASLRTHPDVLELRWQIFATAKKWEECVLIGNALVDTAPARPDSWIHRSYALHELSRPQEASDLLFPAADLFPGHSTIMYNLACYACVLGNMEEAWDWLEDAFELGDAKQMKLRALEDPDLEKLWAEIREI